MPLKKSLARLNLTKGKAGRQAIINRGVRKRETGEENPTVGEEKSDKWREASSKKKR